MPRTEEEQVDLKTLSRQDYPYICSNCGEPHGYYRNAGDECSECGGSLEERCNCPNCKDCPGKS